MGGWVHRDPFVDKCVSCDYLDLRRTIHGLRRSLKNYLNDRDQVKNFIKNDRKGNYRLSIHPDFVTVPNRQWLLKQFKKILQIFIKERKRRGVWYAEKSYVGIATVRG